MKRWPIVYIMLLVSILVSSTYILFYLANKTETTNGEIIGLGIGLIALVISIIQIAENNKLFINLSAELKVWTTNNSSISLENKRYSKVNIKLTNLHQAHISNPRIDIRLPNKVYSKKANSVNSSVIREIYYGNTHILKLDHFGFLGANSERHNNEAFSLYLNLDDFPGNRSIHFDIMADNYSPIRKTIGRKQIGLLKENQHVSEKLSIVI